MSAGSKQAEMTVRRGLILFEAFEELERGQDWTDVPNQTYRKVWDEGLRTSRYAEVIELWERYKNRRLHQEVLDLAANIEMDELSKKARAEIEKGLARIEKGIAK